MIVMNLFVFEISNKRKMKNQALAIRVLINQKMIIMRGDKRS